MSRAAKERFAARLKKAIEDAGFVTDRAPRGIGPLARILDPENPERAERNLHRWLDPDDPTLPHASSRRVLAGALGKDADFFEPRPIPEWEAHVSFLRMLLGRAEREARNRAWYFQDEVAA